MICVCIFMYLLFTYKSVIVFFFYMDNEFVIICNSRFSGSLNFVHWDLPLELYMNSDVSHI